MPMQHPIVSYAQILYKGHHFNNKDFPEKIQSFTESLNNPVYEAWIHYYEEDNKCKIYTEGLSPYLNQIKKFAGTVSLDRSIGWSDKIDDQKELNKVNKHSREVFAENKIPYIINVRFGDQKSYPFCFQDIPQNSILFVGEHGTQTFADYKATFYAGIDTLIKILKPRALLIYGCVEERILDLCKKNDITLVQYPSQCSLAHSPQKPRRCGAGV